MNKKRIIYEIFFPSFAKDLKDLTSKIPYFVELGVTSIWVTPIFPACNYHGYDIVDYTDIKKEYGTLKDFDEFIEAAHANDLEVLLDLVLCHTSTQHKLFKESIKGQNNCYFWSNNQQNNQWRICHENKKYYLAKWSYDMPQLNNQSETVRDMIKNIIKFWLIDHNVDGFRLDAIIYASGDPIEFWKWFCDEVYKIKPNAYIVGEAWDTFEVSSKYARETGMKTFNFEQAGYIKNAVNHYKNDIVIRNDNNSVIFLDNHDQTRITVSFKHDIEKVKRALDLMFSFTNNDICIYYGTEIGMGVIDGHVHCGGQGDYHSRTPMDWNIVEHQRNDSNSLFNYVKKLIQNYKEE